MVFLCAQIKKIVTGRLKENTRYLNIYFKKKYSELITFGPLSLGCHLFKVLNQKCITQSTKNVYGMICTNPKYNRIYLEMQSGQF